MVTPGYFAAMGIPIVRGRGLSDADRRGALKVMVISEALAHAAFPDQDPIGKRIACCESAPDGKSPDFKVVVGVAGDVRSRALGEPPSPEFYLPIDQVPAEGWEWIQRTLTSPSAQRSIHRRWPNQSGALSARSRQASRCFR